MSYPELPNMLRGCTPLDDLASANLMRSAAEEIESLRGLLKQAHSTIKHGAATSVAQAQILHDIEKAVGMKSEAELLKQSK